MAASKKTFQQIFDIFKSPVSSRDCGQHCSAHGDGGPLCCSTGHAVPIAQTEEWHVLNEAGDLWKPFKAYDEGTRELVDSLADSCVAIECKGAMHCERDQRSLSCRAFPFFPYVTREGDFIGMSHYWSFEDSCWMIENAKLVEKAFVSEFAEAYKILFDDDPEELEVFRDYSATMRRVFSRWKRPIPLIALDGTRQQILPYGGGIVPL